MSLFQCENCGCCENTALSAQGFQGFMRDLFSWEGMEHMKGKLLCSACGPSNYRSGKPSKMGSWHGEFERVFLPLGMFKTDDQGNLAHIETGDTNVDKYAINPGV